MYCIQSAGYISGANRPNTLILNVNNKNNPCKIYLYIFWLVVLTLLDDSLNLQLVFCYFDDSDLLKKIIGKIKITSFSLTTSGDMVLTFFRKK